MVATAEAAFPAWRDTDPVERANCLVRAAQAMRARRDELSGIIIKENGKSWRDADADVAEAIDFCAYYARESVGLFTPERLGRHVYDAGFLGRGAGQEVVALERNGLIYTCRGGFIDTAHVLWFVLFTFLFLFLTWRSVESRRWR